MEEQEQDNLEDNWGLESLEGLVTNVKPIEGFNITHRYQGQDFLTGGLRLFNDYKQVGYYDQGQQRTQLYEVVE